MNAQSKNPIEFLLGAMASDNMVGMLGEDRLRQIASDVLDDFDMDKASMSDWTERMEKAIKLASLVKDEKNYPFERASNVKYPLITSAALQFNARAYPAIVPGSEPVKCKTWGQDASGQKAARAARVSSHMSWQLMSQITEWERETDTLLLQLPIVGTKVRKWWFDPVEGRPKCRLIDSDKFVINDKAKTQDAAPRVSEIVPLYPQEIESRIRSGTFADFDYKEQQEKEDKQAAHEFIEQHRRIDLDGDGYEEPYIVTVHEAKREVVRIVADFAEQDISWDMQEVERLQTRIITDDLGNQTAIAEPVVEQVPAGVLSIRRGSYFVDFQFLPGIEGGFHGTGLGLLLGDISNTINSIINQMMDAGHYASLGGGFIGSEFRMKGGAQRHKPGEWVKVEARGGDIRSAVVPMTFPGPDATLFQMLGMLIEAGREIASVKDVMTGEQPRQNQTATTTIALIEQGMMVFTAAYKRIFRSLKDEYRLLARINAETTPAEAYAAFHDEMSEQPEMMGHNGGPALDPADDYDLRDLDIEPVADPQSVTKMQQSAKAQVVMQLAEAGMVDMAEATKRILEAASIDDVEALAPKSNPMEEMMGKLQMEAAMADLVQKKADVELTLAKVESERAKAMKDTADAEATEIEAALAPVAESLKDERERLGLVIRGITGMAGKSGDGASADGDGKANRGPQAIVLPTISGGQSTPGSGPQGPFDGGGMGGGLL